MRLKISSSKNAKSLYVIKSTYENGIRSTKIVEKLGTYDSLLKKLNGQEPLIDRATFGAAAKHFGTSRNNAAGTAKVDYMLSCKCFCGYCGKILRGESGTGKKGKVYNYYKCSTQKRGKTCELKPILKEKLEQAVIHATMKDMLTDDMIERLTKRIMEIQEEDFARDPAAAFRRQLDSNQKKQRNILDAIEDGAPAKGLTTRLMELEKAEEDLLQKIDHAAIKKPRLTAELVRAWLCSFRAGDVSDPDFQRRLLDTFVARVELKNGEAVVFYNARPDHGRGKCSTTITKVEMTGVELLCKPGSPHSYVLFSGTLSKILNQYSKSA